jgi:hypothetical protein
MVACSLRILTGTANLGRSYYTIPLSDKKAYSVSNEVTGSDTFSIRAFMVDDKGSVTSPGATPSLIRQYLGSATCKDIKISSKTGTCYVNVALKQKQETKVGAIARKVEPFIPINPVVGVFVGLAKSCSSAMGLAEENEVHFSISAKKDDTTRFSFEGALTLQEIGQRATQAKAFSVADKSDGDKVAGVLSVLLTGIGGAIGGIQVEETDAASELSQVYDLANSLVETAHRVGS